nr:beta-amyrin 24-hydroxylase [Quercus suber]
MQNSIFTIDDVREEKVFREELETLLQREELMWAQKARCNWITLGYKNTKYFQNVVKQKRARNRILQLRTEDGSVIEDQKGIENLMWYCNLSGQNINLAKSGLFCSPNMPKDEQISLANSLQVNLVQNPSKYLGLDFKLKGTDTSAEGMQWVMAELINHPSVFNKVREEIESIVGKTRLVEESDIPNLPYLQAVVKETLRLYPPGPVTTRECRQN